MWERKPIKDRSGKDAPSASVPCFCFGSDVGDTCVCQEFSCKDARLEHAKAKSVLKSSHNSLNFCNRMQGRPTHMRHKGYTPGACAPTSTATLPDHNGEHENPINV